MLCAFPLFHSSSLHLSVPLQNHSGNIHTEKIQYSVSDFFPYLTIHIHSQKDCVFSIRKSNMALVVTEYV